MWSISYANIGIKVFEKERKRDTKDTIILSTFAKRLGYTLEASNMSVH